MPTYKKNFLKEVVLRLDFETSIPELLKTLPIELEEKALDLYTLQEHKDASKGKITVDVSSGGVERAKSSFKEWNFFKNEKKDRLCLTNDCIFINSLKYINFERFVTPFNSITEILFNNFHKLTVKRVGLRYVNNIELKEKNPLNWNKYLNKNMLSIFNLAENKNEITRAFHFLETNYEEDDLRLVFQYGMHNPDYPAKIVNKIFVLDFDISKTGSLSFDELNYIIPKLNEKAEKLFEKSITNNLRDLMNE